MWLICLYIIVFMFQCQYNSFVTSLRALMFSHTFEARVASLILTTVYNAQHYRKETRDKSSYHTFLPCFVMLCRVFYDADNSFMLIFIPSIKFICIYMFIVSILKAFS